MNYKNAIVDGPDFKFYKTGFGVADGIIMQVGEEHPDAYDLEGQFVIPGLVDIHCHGNSGFLFTNGSGDSLKKIARYFAKKGTTSFSASSVTEKEEVLAAAYRNAVKLHNEKPEGHAKVCGITMEGPFFSPLKKGAMDEKKMCATRYRNAPSSKQRSKRAYKNHMRCA